MPMPLMFDEGRAVTRYDMLVRSLLHVSTIATIILLAAMVIGD